MNGRTDPVPSTQECLHLSSLAKSSPHPDHHHSPPPLTSKLHTKTSQNPTPTHPPNQTSPSTNSTNERLPERRSGLARYSPNSSSSPHQRPSLSLLFLLILHFRITQLFQTLTFLATESFRSRKIWLDCEELASSLHCTKLKGAKEGSSVRERIETYLIPSNRSINIQNPIQISKNHRGGDILEIPRMA